MKSLIAWIALFASAPALAGGIIGNGGSTVNCPHKPPELLDLYEGRALYGFELSPGIPAQGEPLEIAEKLLGRMFNYDPSYYVRVKDGLKHVTEVMRMIAPGESLTPLPDVFPVVLPSGCVLGQLANYNDLEDVVRVDGGIWAQLTDAQRAALLMHEAVYKVERELRFAQDSVISRRVVAHLFGDEALTDRMWAGIWSN
jgi:hypothetical protein